MYGNHMRSLKVQALRDTANTLLVQANAGADPKTNRTLADRLFQRADLIEAGDHDHSTVLDATSEISEPAPE